MMKIIRTEDKPLIPWKNGGGLTREIAVHFDKKHHEGFLWRLSQAIIDETCSFSRFDGIDRSIGVLDGGGILLKSNANPVAIAIKNEPVSFAGEEKITATPIGNAVTTDLNIMTRRGFFEHQMKYCAFVKEMRFEISASITFIVAKSDVVISGQELHPFECATGFAIGDEIRLEAENKGEVFIIELSSC